MMVSKGITLLGKNGHIQQGNQVVAAKIHYNYDVEKLQYIFPQSTLREKNISNHHRERGVNHGSKEHLWSTTNPTKISPQTDRLPNQNHARDVEPEL